MKHLILATATAAVMAGTAGPAFAQYTLNILHINDFHARFQPINAFDSDCGAEAEEAGECFGGAARLLTAVENRRKDLADENLVLLSGGDQFQGSLYYTTYKSEIVADFLDELGFDATAVGNHEFDDGPSELAALIERADTPIVGGNMEYAEGSALDGADIPEHIVLEVGGEQIGVFGAITPETAEISSAGADVSFESVVDYAREKVAELEDQGINKIIMISHVGFVGEQEVAENVAGVDVIVGGHSNTLLLDDNEDAAGDYPFMVTNPDGQDVPIVQAYAYGKYLGDLQVTWDDEGNVTSADGEPILLDASIEKDEDYQARLDELQEPIEEAMAEIVGTTTAPIDGSRETCRAGECEMGNLVTDAMLAAASDATIAITNGGGLRASIDEGEVTMGEVLAVLPFQNTLATFEITGAGMIEALENGVGMIEEGAGRFPQVSGLEFTWDPDAEPGSRIADVMVEEDGEWVPIDPEATYSVVTNNFVRTGGDGYAVFAEDGMNAYDGGSGLETVVANYIEGMDGSYEPYTDGRISTVE